MEKPQTSVERRPKSGIDILSLLNPDVLKQPSDEPGARQQSDIAVQETPPFQTHQTHTGGGARSLADHLMELAKQR